MWLAYGLSQQDELIHISEVARGKTSLMCPYCGGRLTGVKGRKRVHHFRHTETTCHPSSSHHDFYDITQETFPLEMGLYEYGMTRRQEIEQEGETLKTSLETLKEETAKADQILAETLEFLETVSQPYKNGNRPKNRQQNVEVLQEFHAFLNGETRLLPSFQKVRHGSVAQYYHVIHQGDDILVYGSYSPKDIWLYRQKDFMPMFESWGI